MINFEQLVIAAGGAKALADAIGGTVKAQHIVNWRQRGIPSDRVKDIIRGARARDCEITPHQLRPDLYPAGFQFSDEELAPTPPGVAPKGPPLGKSASLRRGATAGAVEPS